MSQFAVVLDVYAFDHWQAAAQVLAEVLGLHLTTANQRTESQGAFLPKTWNAIRLSKFNEPVKLRGWQHTSSWKRRS